MIEKSVINTKIKKLISQYKYVVPILAVGIVLLLWPSNAQKEIDIITPETKDADIVSDTEKKLESILETAYGVGRVRVCLSPESTAVITYAEDRSVLLRRNVSNEDLEQTSETNIVTTRDSDGNESAVIITETLPKYRGALIICDGGDDPSVKLMITKAVSNLLQIGTDAIVVMKMEK